MFDKITPKKYFFKMFFLGILFVFFQKNLFAQQYKFPDSPSDFVTYTSDQIKLLKRPEALALADNFSQAWGSLSANQTKIIEIAKKLVPARVVMQGGFQHYFRALTFASKNANASQISSFLETSDKIAGLKDVREINFFFERSANFFEYKALFLSKNNRMFATGGDFTFQFLAEKDDKLQAEFASSEEDSLSQSTKAITGAIIKFTNTNIYLSSPQDSVPIAGTKGLFLLTKNIFVGKGGKFDWKSVELDPNKVFCEMDVYQFDVARGYLKASNVKMTHTDFFKTPIKGDMEFTSRPRKDAKSAQYPRFISLENNTIVNNILPNLNYKGGFSLEGRKFNSASKKSGATAILTGKSPVATKGGYDAFRVESRKFIFNDTTVTSNEARVSLYFNDAKDSLFHNNLEFTYDTKPKMKDKELGNIEIRLVRNRNSTAGKAPLVNNFHKFYMDIDALRYYPEKDTLNGYMVSGSLKADSLRPALLESFHYFNIERYNELRGLTSFHPIQLLTAYSDDLKKRNLPNEKFSLDSLLNWATKAKKGQDNQKNLIQQKSIYQNIMLDLKGKGFIEYNEGNGNIVLSPRLFHNDISNTFIKAVDNVQKTPVKEQALKTDLAVYNKHDYDDFLVVSVMGAKFDKTKKQFDAGSVLPNISMKFDGNQNIMKVRGISRFYVSQQLNLQVVPDTSKQEISMFKGNSMFMEKGTITVGNFRFVGQKFFFVYELFLLEMPFLEKILFEVEEEMTDEEKKKDQAEKAKNPRYRTPRRKTHLYGREVAFQPGQLEINNPLNKSGLKRGKILEQANAPTECKNYEEYPRLTIEGGGEMFFQEKYRQNLAYDSLKLTGNERVEVKNKKFRVEEIAKRNGAVFAIDPISMDSLTTKKPIFPGWFISNIFPPIKENLIPMPFPDTTMGFVHKAPKAGYPLYPIAEKVKGAKIVFSTDLIMRNEGLYAGGEISYLTTKFKSPAFVFMPDSSAADDTEFEVALGKTATAEYPSASGKKSQLRWDVTNDKLVFMNKEEIALLEAAHQPKEIFDPKYKEKLFSVYDKSNPITIRGSLTVTANEGLQGEGNLVRKDFSLLSVGDELFKFKINGFKAGNVDLRVNSKDFDPYTKDETFYNNFNPVMFANFATVDFDFKNGKADVKPSPQFAENSTIEFPYAKYRTSMREALWDLSKQTINMTGDSTSFFVSTIYQDEEQDVSFRANKALYDIPKLMLSLEGVKNINSADASILPKEGKAIIKQNAEIQEFKEARVLIDTLNKYHRLFNANIRIKSKTEFEGDATYQFTNVKKDTFNIKFSKFSFLIDEEKTTRKERKAGKEKKYTYAEGTVEEKDKFYITSRVIYKGLVKMYANRKDLTLDGFIKLDLSSRKDYNSWLPYKSDKGDAVSLEIEEKKQIGSDIISSGLHFNGANDLYTTFLSPQSSPVDKPTFLASGLLDYNPAINQFKISPQKKREGKAYTGNTLIFDDSKGSLYLEGKPTLIDEGLSKFLQMSGMARIDEKDEKNKKYEFDLLLTVEPEISSKAHKQMEKELLAKFKEKPLKYDHTNDPLTFKIAEIVGEKSYRPYVEDMTSNKPLIAWKDREMRKMLNFGKIEFVWSSEYKTFHSVNIPRLLSTGDKIIDVETPVYAEIRKGSGGNGDAFTLYFQPHGGLWYYFEYEQNLWSAISSDELFNKYVASKSVTLAGADKRDAFIAKFKEVYKAPALPDFVAPVKEEKKEEKKEEEKKEEKKEEEKKEEKF